MIDIDFNFSMQTNLTKLLNISEPYNLEDVINSTYLNITLIPSKKRFELRDELDYEIFNFEWKPISYEGKKLRIQLNFT